MASQTCLERLELFKELWKSTQQEPALDAIYEQVRDDRHELRAIIGRLGMSERRRSPWHELVLRLSRWHMVHRTPSPRCPKGTQMELDTIGGQLHAKLAMWNTLLSLVTSDPRLDPVQLMRLSGRTQKQIDALAKFAEQTRPEQFTTNL
ncbi:hypothetical protein OK351_09685 [Glutamicibacter sp. MNS18]|uniref:hypothetical protein n=1 Tax=Glutamicibacter sp. MNS18 TaxID=2989817 RepID=UPI002236626C|nr:hypothetical protein [Glutamicibacter sp. MNS18]MCW4465778.1 hypothetical protein [Glutamicibacter sp. MNS18]